MPKDPPAVYLLHGEDEFAIAQFVRDLEARLGDSAIAEMNTSRFDGRNLAFRELAAVAHAVPFLANRRLVILTNPLAWLQGPSNHEQLLSLLDSIPASTALVLVEYRRLTDEKARGKQSVRWLVDWARKAGDHCYVRVFDLPGGEDNMATWIRKKARQMEGEFSPEAAKHLANLVGEDTRLADQEIRKLLTYVNFQRPVEVDDVRLLTPYEGQLEDFALVNALREGDAEKALKMLERSLEEEDPVAILHAIVYQFRLLLLARDVLEGGGQVEDAVRTLTSQFQVHPYPARLAARQAGRFDLSTLKAVYRKLLDVDEGIKTGKIDGALALETLVISLTS